MSRSEIPEKDYGEPLKYDPTFNGPIHKRSCTDLICLLLFVVFMGCWGAVGWYAITTGDVKKILAPTDSNGHKCGLDSSVIDKPYLVFFDITKCLSLGISIGGCPTMQVCVEKCPTENLFRLQVENDPTLSMDEIRRKIICTVDPSTVRDKPHLLQLMDIDVCAENVLISEPVLRRCFGNIKPLCNLRTEGDRCVLARPKKPVPKSSTSLESIDTYIGTFIAGIVQYFSNDKDVLKMGNNIIEDVVNSRWSMLIALVIVMVICFIYIALMRWIAGPVVWFSIVGVIVGLSYSIYLSYDRYSTLRDNPVVVKPSNTNLSNIGKSLVSLQETWLVILIAASVVLVIILLMVIFLRKRIVIAIALIKEGSKAVSSIKSTVFFPILPWIFQILVLAFALVVGLYLTTIGEPNYKAYINQTDCGCNYTMGSVCTPEKFVDDCITVAKCKDVFCHYVGITNSEMVKGFLAIDVVAFFWMIFFLDGFGQMVLAATFATWYWTFKKSDVPFFTLTAGIFRTLTFNLGTIAFGSLIITICRVIRLILEYIDHKVKKYDNTITRAIMCCLKCCFKCLESFLKFINKNAYIMCAVHGKAFLPSARDAFSLLMRNILRVFVLDKVTDFLFFLSKLIVALGCGVGAYFAFTSPELYKLTDQEKLHYDLVPPIIIGVAAYLIASVFFSVYSMAVDTLFLCFLEDCERNDGSETKPYFMSKQLRKILGKKNIKRN